MLSRNDKENRKASSNTTPMRDLNDASVTSRTSRPSTRTLPWRTSRNRGTSSANVDFPEPLVPTNATRSPAAMRSDTSSTATAPPGYTTLT